MGPAENSSSIQNMAGGDEEASGEASGQFKQQNVITFKNRDYLLYEGRIIDESEADRIYTAYHEMLTQK